MLVFCLRIAQGILLCGDNGEGNLVEGYWWESGMSKSECHMHTLLSIYLYLPLVKPSLERT